MANEVCTVSGCERPVVKSGLCNMHRNRKRRGDPNWDDPTPRQDRELWEAAPPDGLCSVEGCDRKYLAKGLCKLHYHRKRRGAPNWDTLELRRPGRPKGPLRICSIEGCEKPAVAHGLCPMHRERKKSGAANWDDPAPWVVKSAKAPAEVEYCRNGHERTPANTSTAANGKRRCRICHRKSVRKGKLSGTVAEDMHGKPIGYSYGCRCTDCRRYHAEESQQYKWMRRFGPGAPMGPEVRERILESLQRTNSVMESAAEVGVKHQAIYGAARAVPGFGDLVDQLTARRG